MRAHSTSGRLWYGLILIHLLTVNFGWAQQGPVWTQRGPIGSALIRPATAALLLTPSQISQMDAAWLESQTIIAPIQKLGTKVTPEQKAEMMAAREQYFTKVNEVLTVEQKDVRQLISELFVRVSKEVAEEFGLKLEAAATPEEKKVIAREQGPTFESRLLDELKISLSAERVSAYQAAWAKPPGSN